METTITIKEFLSNPKDYLDMAEKADIILTGKKKTKFYLGLCSEDDEITEEDRIEIEKCMQQSRDGKTTIIGDGSMEDLIKYMAQ